MKKALVVAAGILLAFIGLLAYYYLPARPRSEFRRSQELIDSVTSRVKMRFERTGTYAYESEDERVLEQALKMDPNNTRALHALSWAYSTYERHRGDNGLHTRSLEYARRTLRLEDKSKLYVYEVLGAALYANGKIEEGDKAFDQALRLSRTSEEEKYYLKIKERVRSMHLQRRK